MQTSFSLAQLANPDIAEANKILRACVHCGFCTATCPTYVLLGDELDSPRGRIYLIKDMLEQDRAAGEVEVKHIDRCLSCLSCMTTCPSGVHYMHLVDQARVHIEKTHARPTVDYWLRRLLATILPRPHLFRLALTGASLARSLGAHRWLPRRLRAMVGLAKEWPARPRATDRPGVFPAQGERRGRVAILAGCAQPVLRPEINEAAIRLLNRLGIEVVVAEGAGCCGALTHHMGFEEAAHESAKATIAAWHREIAGEGLDAIVITTSGCGTVIKDYGYIFRNDPEWKDRAQAVSARALDISEYLARLGPLPASEGRKAEARLPRRLLAAARADGDQRAQGAAAAGRLRGGRRAGGAPVLRLGRHLQHAAARSLRRAARPQGRQHQRPRAAGDRDRQHRLHAAARGRGERADPAHGGAAGLGDRRAGAKRSAIMTERWRALGAIDELKQKPLRQVIIDKVAIALSYRDGKFGAISGRCNHVGGPLGDG